MQYHLSHRVETVRVRPFNHIGPRQRQGFVAPDFARQIAEIEAGRRAPEVVVGALDAIRDFSDVRDIVRGYYLALTQGEPGEVYNLGSGMGHSVANFGQPDRLFRSGGHGGPGPGAHAPGRSATRDRDCAESGRARAGGPRSRSSRACTTCWIIGASKYARAHPIRRRSRCAPSLATWRKGEKHTHREGNVMPKALNHRDHGPGWVVPGRFPARTRL